jgi:glycosyltransferase involved in cell wall biosynthesis
LEVKSHRSSLTEDMRRVAKEQRKSRSPGLVFLDSLRDSAQAGRVPELTTCAVVIPCFNEGASIAALVAAARRQFSRVLVVDDGSTDDTAARAQSAGAQVVTHAKNLGKGAALRTGLSQARQQGFAWAFTLDGDGQHAPDEMPAFLECAGQTGALLVVGNRMPNAQAVPWLRRQVNRWMSRKLSQRAGCPLPDSQSGFRLIHLQTWSSLPLKTERFEVESEMLLAFLAAEHPVSFVPIRVISRSRRSHIHPVADSWRWWKWWCGLNASSLVSQQPSVSTIIQKTR